MMCFFVRNNIEVLWTELWPPPRPPPKSHVEALTPSMTVCGDRACEEVIKVK